MINNSYSHPQIDGKVNPIKNLMVIYFSIYLGTATILLNNSGE